MLMLKAAPAPLLLTEGHKPNIDAACYLTSVLDPSMRRGTIDRIIRDLRSNGIEFDAIACRGLSGLLVAPIVAMEMHKTLIVVRKAQENNHSGRLIEGDTRARRYIIIDDIISSGDTIRAIITGIRDECPKMACIGIYRYFGCPTKPWMPFKDFCLRYAPRLLENPDLSPMTPDSPYTPLKMQYVINADPAVAPLSGEQFKEAVNRLVETDKEAYKRRILEGERMWTSVNETYRKIWEPNWDWKDQL